MRRLLLLLSCLIILLTSCITTKKSKNLSYLSNDTVTRTTPKLTIFSPKKQQQELTPVLIFVHGGNWNRGKKETYSFLGRNFAKKGVITIIPGYTLSPLANYEQMTYEIAKAILWVKKNISSYGGDPNRIFLTGHSAGGHLITLATLDSTYGIPEETIAGVILNDAAGLDMYTFLKKNKPTTENNYLTTWTSDPEKWKDASPIYHIHEKIPPFMVYLGNKTYPSIISSNKKFIKAIKPYQSSVSTIFLNKSHSAMITQYINPRSKRYQEVIAFMEANR